MIKKFLKRYNDLSLPAKAAIWFVFCSLVQKGISLITTPIFTRMMTTEQYGQFSVYNSWLSVFSIFTSFRLNYAVFNKGMVEYKEDRDAYTSTMQSLTFIFNTVFFLFYIIFREQINALTELPTFIMLAMILEMYFVPAIDLWTVRKRYEYQYKPVVLRTILMALLNAGVGVVAVYLSDEKGYARILTCVVVNVAFGVVLYIRNYKVGKKIFVLNYAKFALLFNLPLILHYCSQYILDQSDRIMIQKLVGVSEAGIYSVAYNAGLILKILTDSINNALVPWEYEQLESHNFKKLDKCIFEISLLVGSCVVLYSLFAPELMRIFASESYYEAVYVIPPVSLGMYFMFLYMSFANVEFFYNANKFTMYISLIGAALNIGLNYICILKFGYIAAAYTSLFCYIIYALSHYLYMSHCVKESLHIKGIFKITRLMILSIAFIVITLLTMVLYDRSVIRYAIIGTAFLICIVKRKTIIYKFKNIKI